MRRVRGVPTLAMLDGAARDAILALRAHGLSYDGIAAVLNRRGVKGISGGRWYGATVFRVVRAAARAPQQPWQADTARPAEVAGIEK